MLYYGISNIIMKTFGKNPKVYSSRRIYVKSRFDLKTNGR